MCDPEVGDSDNGSGEFFLLCKPWKMRYTSTNKVPAISGLDFALQMNPRENSHEVESRIIKIKR